MRIEGMPIALLRMIESRRQQFLAALIGNWDQQFDPGTGLLASETTPLRDSLLYALALLEQGEHARLGRAEAILRQVIKDQPALAADQDEWGTFALIWIWERHRRRLGTKAVESISAIFSQEKSPAEAFQQRFIELTLRRSDPSFPFSPQLPADLSLKQIIRLLLISHSDSSVRCTKYKRQSLQFSQNCWDTFVDWVEVHHAPPDSHKTLSLSEQDSTTLDLLLEKITRGQLQTARFPVVPSSPEYLFTLISDIEVSPYLEKRLIQAMRQASPPEIATLPRMTAASLVHQ